MPITMHTCRAMVNLYTAAMLCWNSNRVYEPLQYAFWDGRRNERKDKEPKFRGIEDRAHYLVQKRKQVLASSYRQLMYSEWSNICLEWGGKGRSIQRVEFSNFWISNKTLSRLMIELHYTCSSLQRIKYKLLITYKAITGQIKCLETF